MDIYLTFSAFLICLLPKGTHQGSNEKRLLHYLFKEKYFNPLERPVENESLPIRVNFSLILQQIIDVEKLIYEGRPLHPKVGIGLDKLKFGKRDDFVNGFMAAAGVSIIGKIEILKSILNQDELSLVHGEQKVYMEISKSGTDRSAGSIGHGGHLIYDVDQGENMKIRANKVLFSQDEKNQIIHTNIWLNMRWKAFNLVWDPYEFGGIESIRVPAKQIWIPDILMYNSADEKFDGTFHTNVIVQSDGTCIWIPPGMFKSTCSIDITWFPFDDQKCDLKFGSWTHDGRFLDLQMEDAKGGDTSNFIRNGEWELIELPVRRNVQTYECCPEFYIDLVYTIHIRRRTLYYGFNIIIPCLLISSMSLLLFLLPPDAGEKISLGVTILLSLMVFLLLVAETMPPTSDALPLIGIYFCCIMVMTSLSVLFTVVVLNFHYRGPETHIMPPWVKFGINVALARILCMSRPKVEKRRQSMRQRQRLGDIQMPDRTTHNLLPNLLESEEEYRACLENGGYGVRSNDEWIRPPPARAGHGHNQQVADEYERMKYLENMGAASYRVDVVQILSELKKITYKLKQDEDDNEIKNEWKFAALVIDRLCLWLCLAATSISTLSILCSAPHLVA